MDAQPSIFLVGYGSGGGLQLTLDGQQALGRARKVYTLAPPPRLQKLLKSMRLPVEDLSPRFAPGAPFSDAYLDVADLLLRRAVEEPPIAFLMPGNPLFLNSLSRFLVMQTRERDIGVQVLPGVSPVDVIVNELGLDVSTFGLQMFEATRLVQRALAPNPEVPLLVLQLGGFALDRIAGAGDERAAEVYLPLVRHLARFYPPEFPATVMSIGAGVTRVTRPLAGFPELVPHIGADSHLFLDAFHQKHERG